MLKIIIILFAGFQLCTSASAQCPEIEQFATRFFESFRYNDTAVFNQSFISNKEVNRLLSQHIRLNNIQPGKDDSAIQLPDLQRAIAIQFKVARKKLSDSGINWASAKYEGFFYNLVREKSSIYPSAKGEILVQSGNRYFSIVLNDMIFINGKWKLISFFPGSGQPVQPKRVSYFIAEDQLFLDTAPQPPQKKPAVKKAGG
jgi:hypothetical protein